MFKLKHSVKKTLPVFTAAVGLSTKFVIVVVQVN
jgi:hypothetical protein